MAFKQSGEVVFDRLFSFERGLKETFAYANVGKNGSLAQKQQMDILELMAQSRNSGLVNSLAKDISDGIFPRVSDMLEQSGNSISGLIDSLLQPAQSIEPDVNPVELARRKRLSQQIQQDQGLSRYAIFPPRICSLQKRHPHEILPIFALCIYG